MADKAISVLGSAGHIDATSQQAAQDVGRMIAHLGFNLVCGGLGGVMAASCEGFQQAPDPRGRTLGYLPGYDPANANSWVDIVLPTGLDIGRNQLIVAAGTAVLAIGGGAGTLSEIALASQMGKPIGLVTWCGGWAADLREGYLDHRKTSFLQRLNTLEEVQAFLEDCLKHQSEALSVNGWHDR